MLKKIYVVRKLDSPLPLCPPRGAWRLLPPFGWRGAELFGLRLRLGQSLDSFGQPQQQRSGDVNRAVRSYDNAHQEREGKRPNPLSAEDVDHQQTYQNGA